MSAYELVDHTADLAIRISASDLKSLFKNAAVAMFKLMATPQKGVLKPSSRKYRIELVADSQEELIVRWLNELLSLSECKKNIFTDFEILDLSSRHLLAIVRGKSRKYFQVTTEIKAVTYHGLKIQKENSLYTVQIIFDV